jgi:hypothetical protein
MKIQIFLARAMALLLAASAWATPDEVQAVDFSNGQATAVPLPNGRAPRIDGDLSDFDFRAGEPVYISEGTARGLHTDWALMYDEQNLYVGVRAGLPNRPLRNPNNPQDAFWSGDILQLRIAADPNLPYPLDGNRDAASERIAHVSMWKNTETGEDFLHFNRGTKLDRGQDFNPPGSAIEIVTQNSTGYTVEARIPWAALRAPGGRNPFAAGQKAAFVIESLWVGGDQARTAAVYGRNPGTFAFNQPGTWGQLTFAAQAPAQRVRPTLESLFARFEAAKAAGPAEVGVPIQVNVPRDGLKVSVNILGARGEVVRELMGGAPQPKGLLSLRWDGKDQWGRGVVPGSYRWGAYFSSGLRAEYLGGVGKSGHPYYETPDARGGWGADHSNPLDTAADGSGMYFLWPVSESGRALVKTDYAGQVLWRRTPFIGGGFGPLYAIASNSRHVFVTHADSNPQLARLDAATGRLLLWGEASNAPSLMPISESTAVRMPEHDVPLGGGHGTHDTSAGAPTIEHPESVGLAASEGEVFAPVYSKNIVQVMDAATGARTRTLEVAAPRGVALSANGDLFVVSAPISAAARVVKFAGARGAAQVIVSQNLSAPWDVAVDGAGRIFVSDGGASQQVKVFDARGSLVQARGKVGGRHANGAFDVADARAFLSPAGLAVDAQNGLLVVESSIPKLISRFASDGRLVRRWFGAPTYWSASAPDPDDPRTVYYELNGGLGRARVRGESNNPPNGYYSLSLSGFDPALGNFESLGTPQVFRARNGRKYLLGDHTPHTLAVFDGDKLRPVAMARTSRTVGGQRNESLLELWADKNSDGRIQGGEIVSREFELRGRKVIFAPHTNSGSIGPNGDLYLLTQSNAVLRVPCEGFAPNGAPRWNLGAAHFAIEQVLPGRDEMHSTWRHGLLGVRRDAQGNFYVCFNAQVGSGVGAFQYATPTLAQRMREGMGHAATFDTVKFAKYNARGELLWMAGRKATASARAGEMYHFWQLAGLVEREPGTGYVAGGSEWGQIYFYTHDGFFVDSLMNNPGENPPPGPYTFGGETNSGRVRYFPARDEVYAYAVGMAYRVRGFERGRVQGESRAAGTVALDRVYEPAPVAPTAPVAPLQIARVAGDAMKNAALWEAVPTSTSMRNGATLATAQLAYNDGFLFGRIHVADDSPLQNSADTVQLAFKGGDTAGFVLGPAGERALPGAGGAPSGPIRLMAARVNDRDTLIAMKSVTSGEKRPFEYTTPAAGTARFEWVGEVPGAQVLLAPDADGRGYTATFAVPRAFLEFDLAPNAKLAGDLEVRLSGAGPRGLQATSRNYLFTPSRTETSMTDDVPTEARIYRQFFGPVEVR